MTKNVFMYWYGIIKQAWSKTKKKLGIAGMLLDSIIAISGVFLYHYFINDGNYNIGEILFGLAVFLVIMLLFEFYYVITIPAMRDIEQKEIIANNDALDLNVGIGEDDLGEDSYLVFHSFYKDVDITEMFAQVEELFISNLNAKEFFDEIGKAERKDMFSDSKYIGKTLKWVTNNVRIERISLKPNESARVLFLESVSDSEIVHFGFDTLHFRNDLNKNDFQENGMYEVYINVYGKIAHETKYRKRTFVVFIKFEQGKETEIINSISIDTYLQWSKSPKKPK